VTCVEDIELRSRLGEAARRRGRAYSAERMAAAMAAHYRDLLSTRAAA
jgi:glycosyltransferase involved in cell wall biosynthesis